MDGYRPRIVDRELDELLTALAALAAVALEGPNGVGKRATAARRARTTYQLDLEGPRRLLDAEPNLLATVPGPVLLDEWQRWPQSWDLLRRAVDNGAKPGRYQLTGSAAPLDAAIHSGAGRIVSLRMRPLALAERGLERPSAWPRSSPATVQA